MKVKLRVVHNNTDKDCFIINPNTLKKYGLMLDKTKSASVNDIIMNRLIISSSVEEGYIAICALSRKILGIKLDEEVEVEFDSSDIMTIVTIDNPTPIFKGEQIAIIKEDLIKGIREKFEHQKDSYELDDYISCKAMLGKKEIHIFVRCKSDECKPTPETIFELKCKNANTVIYTEVSESKTIIDTIYDLKFENLGIGGLDEEFKVLFRKAFLSRTLSLDMIKNLKIKHSKGILLYGLPGCGKTLIARQISSLFSATLKIVNGPEIFNMYLGQSEQNIRDLFKDAQEEYKLRGEKSKLHVVVFDEFDSIATSRNSKADCGAVNKVVNQLLTIMDGVEMVNNLLIIGLTNRKELIDPALLRPGRFDVQIEIKAPDTKGIRQIYEIKTKHLKEAGYLSEDFDIDELVELSRNFTGAEIEYAVNNAVNIALFERRGPEDSLLIVLEDFEKSIKEIIDSKA